MVKTLAIESQNFKFNNSAVSCCNHFFLLAFDCHHDVLCIYWRVIHCSQSESHNIYYITVTNVEWILNFTKVILLMHSV
jgi:hypothetical protein